MTETRTNPSRTLQTFPLPTRAFLFAVALLAGIRLYLAFSLESLATVPNGDLDTFVYFQKESNYRTSSGKSPTALLLGSSRIQYLLPRNLAEALDMPEHQVGSYGFAASNLWTYGIFLKRNPELLSQCRVLVLEVIPGSVYYIPYLQGRTRTVFSRYATLDERLSLPTARLRAQAIADLTFPAWSLRNNALGWRVFINQMAMTPSQRLDDYVTPGTLTNRAARYRPLPKASNDEVERSVAPPPVPHIPAMNSLRDILELAPSTCTIVFWLPPMREDFVERIKSNPQYAESFAAFRRELAGLNDSRVRIVWYDDPGAAHFAYEEYKDADHFIDSVIQNKLAAEAARVVRIHLADSSRVSP